MLTDQNAPTALTESADADPNLTLQMQQKAATAPIDGVIPPPPPLANATSSPAMHTLPTPLRLAPTGGASDAGTPSTITAGPQLPSPAAPLPSSTSGSQGPYTAADTALDSTILPNADPRLTADRALVDNAAGGVANVDRVALAKQAFNTFKSETDPAYAATMQDAARYGAAGGQVGSGQLRTRFGDLALQRSRDLQNEEDGLVQNATQGSIQDSFQKLGALSGLEGQQYGEGANDRNELRQERGNKLNTGLSLLGEGSSGNPADHYAQMARQLGMDPSALQALTKAYSSQS
jgi:hypothetical protein